MTTKLVVQHTRNINQQNEIYNLKTLEPEADMPVGAVVVSSNNETKTLSHLTALRTAFAIVSRVEPIINLHILARVDYMKSKDHFASRYRVWKFLTTEGLRQEQVISEWSTANSDTISWFATASVTADTLDIADRIVGHNAVNVLCAVPRGSLESIESKLRSGWSRPTSGFGPPLEILKVVCATGGFVLVRYGIHSPSHGYAILGNIDRITDN